VLNNYKLAGSASEVTDLQALFLYYLNRVLTDDPNTINEDDDADDIMRKMSSEPGWTQRTRRVKLSDEYPSLVS
jgi:hypothetical protein